MIRHRLALLALLLLAIVGCRQAPIRAFGALTLNTSTENHPESCAGGLEVKVRLSNVEIYNNVVAAGEEDTRGIGTAQIPDGYNLVYEDAPVVAEAWCFGESGAEVGYAKRQGRLNVYNRTDSVQITPFVPGRIECVPQVQRGDFPCIDAYTIK